MSIQGVVRGPAASAPPETVLELLSPALQDQQLPVSKFPGDTRARGSLRSIDVKQVSAAGQSPVVVITPPPTS